MEYPQPPQNSPLLVFVVLFVLTLACIAFFRGKKGKKGVVVADGDGTEGKKLTRWRRWLMHWNEGPLALVALAVFVFLPSQLHRIDPSAGSFDMGYLHVLAMVVLFFYAISFTSWTATRLNYPVIYKEFTECLENDIANDKDTERSWRVFWAASFINWGYQLLLLLLTVAILFSGPQ